MQIYLDESHRVRIDPTPDGRIARDAELGKRTLAMADSLEQITMALFDVAKAQGSDARPLFGALADIRRLKFEVRAQVVARHNESN